MLFMLKTCGEKNSSQLHFLVHHLYSFDVCAFLPLLGEKLDHNPAIV